MCRLRCAPAASLPRLEGDAGLGKSLLPGCPAAECSGAPYEHDPLAPWQRPATAGGTAAVHGGLLPLTAAAEFVSWRPSPSPSPSPNASLVVHADESVGSCSGPAQHLHQLTAALGHRSTANSCGDGTPAPEQQQLASRPRCTAKRPRDAQPVAAAMVPPPARVVILSARILAVLAAAANRRRGLHPPAALAPEGSADNFGGDCSEADSGSVRSAKRRRLTEGLQAAAEYRSASEAARAAAALERSMGPSVAPPMFGFTPAGPFCPLQLPPLQLPPLQLPPLQLPPLLPALQAPPVPCPSIPGWDALIGSD